MKEVIGRWYDDISKLYAGVRDDPEMVYNEEFFQDILTKRKEFDQMEDEQQQMFSRITADPGALNSEISLKEVIEAVDRVKNGKAYLLIPNDALKSINSKILLHKFFNMCFQSGMSPTAWNFSDIIPIPKPDKDPRDPLQNRCISILCCVSKVYSSLLNRRIQVYLEENNILVDEQNGFRATRSCIDHIYVLVTVLRNRKEQNKDTFLAFIDYKKAFDSVERNLLFFKLASIGIRGQIYKAISSLYSNPVSRVVLKGGETDYFSCPIGVKQGDCLSPTLFAIFVNDLAQDIKEAGLGIDLDVEDCAWNLSILLYADDIVCLSGNEQDLQSILFIIEDWCKKWRLEVNLAKTNILHVRKCRRPQSKFCFLFNNRPVQYAKSYKYLGVHINEHLNFQFMIEKHAEAAERALSAVITKMIKNGGFPLSIYTMLYDSCVTSVADYSAAVSGFSESTALTKIQLRAVRAFLGVPKNAPNAGVLSEVNWLLPKYRTQLAMVRHYHRLLNMEDNRLTKKIFIWDKELNKSKLVSSWFNEVRIIFTECNLELLFNMGVNFDINFTINYVKLKCLEKQCSSLSEQCMELPKLRTFIQFKDFNHEPLYVKKHLTFYHRRLLAKARLGCLPLRIETGRYSVPRLPEDKRTCQMCDGDGDGPFIESESHFLFVCKAYRGERDSWFKSMTLPQTFQSLPTTEKLKIALNDSNNIRPTAIFMSQALSLREIFLNAK